MLAPRVIPCLLLSKGGGLVKTTKFMRPKYIGDPINAVRIFNEKEVDELMILDIDASKDNSGPDFSLVDQLAGECFMPLCYGGGVRNMSDVKVLFNLGVEKICLQSVAVRNPKIIREIADRYGEQSVVVSIDVKRDWLGRPRLFSHTNIRFPTNKWHDALLSSVRQGAGEICLNSVDRDGMRNGMDLALISEASRLINVPLIAMGGVGGLYDIKYGIKAGASAVAAGAYFVFQGKHRAVLITYPRHEELQDLWRN